MQVSARLTSENGRFTVAEAAGRVNLIGEHTDYNGGFVLPTAIPQTTKVQLAPRVDRLVRVWSENYPADAAGIQYELGQETLAKSWSDYVQGVTYALHVRGLEIGGFDLRISSTVPVGSGLSSSAALEISILRALRETFELDLNDVELARIGQQAENDFVGALVGIMDQMAASLADASTALFLDTRSLEFQRVPLPSSAAILVIHSGISHSNASGEYNLRRSQCEEACRLMGVELLRSLTTDDLPRIDTLPHPLSRRSRHVVTENARVLDAVKAMERDDVRELGSLFAASHASMRDDYEVSIPEIDLLVDIATNDDDVFGARMTGGGFGGSIVALTIPGRARAAGLRILADYRHRSGQRGTVFVPPQASEAGDETDS